MTILGAAIAAAGAGLVWLWEISPIPTLVILTPIIEGFVVGAVLALMVKRLRIRNALLAGVLGCGCGLLSIGLVHYGHYVRMASLIKADFADRIREHARLNDARRKEMLAKLEREPDSFIDQVIAPRADGHRGFVGSMIWRNKEGVMVKRSKVTGVGLWLLWGFEALLVTGFATGLAAAAAGEPFCEDCQTWCTQSKNVEFYPAALADDVTQAVNADDAGRITALKTAVPETQAPGSTAIDLHSCPSCGLSFASVVVRVPTQKKDQVKETTKAKHICVSPNVVKAIRTARVEEPTGSAEPQQPGQAGATSETGPAEDAGFDKGNRE
jgi:phosphate/sulfate permease